MEQEISISKKYTEGVSFYDALKLAEGKRLISNAQADRILQDKDIRDKFSDLFPCWTGTVVIYEEAGKPFGEYVKNDYFVFDVPKQFQGLKDVCLVAEHPHYKIEEGKYGLRFLRVADEANIRQQEFPKEYGWYLPDEVTGIPRSDKKDSSDSKARKLWRSVGAWIGPLVRYYYNFYGRRLVYAVGGPDDRLGVGLWSHRPN